MSVGAEAHPVLTILGTFVYCVASAVIPVFHAEAYLITMSALLPPAFGVPLVLAATVGQMIGKSAMYYMGRGVVRLPGERMRRFMAKAEEWGRSRPGIEGSLVFVSASTGFPPFYVTSIACGMLKVRFATFFALGLLGRLVRFTVAVLIPQVLKHL
jgi:membrane protein YqaA with SNARE-associated domain